MNINSNPEHCKVRSNTQSDEDVREKSAPLQEKRKTNFNWRNWNNVQGGNHLFKVDRKQHLICQPKMICLWMRPIVFNELEFNFFIYPFFKIYFSCAPLKLFLKFLSISVIFGCSNQCTWMDASLWRIFWFRANAPKWNRTTTIK